MPCWSAQPQMRPLATVTRCSTTAEPNISRKKYSSGFASCQSWRARFLAFPARAHRDQHGACAACAAVN